MSDTPNDRKRDNILIIYDICDDKRRRKVVKILESYGMRVQYSAFEVFINQKQYEQLIKKLLPELKLSEDSLRTYVLFAPAKINTWGPNYSQLDDTIIL